MSERVAAERTRPLPHLDRRAWWIDAAVLAAVAVALRIPAFVASRHLTYDDGFFGLSAIEMRAGAVPFKELFSPQGPLHLPLLYLADLVGLRTTNAPRVLPIVAGAAVTVVTYAAGRRITSRFGAIVAAVLVTTSGSIVWVTTGIASDGPALAFSIGAVAVAFGYTQEPRSGRALAAGALLGAGVVAKALAAPAGVAVVILLLSRRRPRDLAYAAGAGVVVALGAALPWGLGRVWDQSVSYNRNASRLTSYWGAVTKAWHTLVDRDPIVLVAVGLALVMLVLARLGWVRAAEPSSSDGSVVFRPVTVLAAWFAAQFALLVYEPAFWRPHVAFLIAPLALLVALRPPPLVALLVGAIAVAPWYWSNLHSQLWPDPYNAAERAAVDDLRNLPPGALALSDEPGFLWRADRLTDPYFDDSSAKRIEQRQITADKLARTAAKPDVCAVLVWTSRYGDLDLDPRLAAAGYEVTAHYGGPRVLYEKRDCRPG
ncbi:MAG TPA: glycosyltransferase family 39 protein [Acidimicrobiia bacterium]|nr:glycosyltransferase family 39 protein [Acidimicrobiia bacterium]